MIRAGGGLSARDARRAALNSIVRGPPPTCDSGRVSNLNDLANAIRAFNTERDWHRFHDPKSLVLALVGEVGELAELLQWVPAATVGEQVREGRLHERLGEELADILIYLIVLADEADIDLSDAATAKLAAASRRFPPDKFAGRAPDKLT